MVLSARRGLRHIIKLLKLGALQRWYLKKCLSHCKCVIFSCRGFLPRRQGGRSTFQASSLFALAITSSLFPLVPLLHSYHFYKPPHLLFCLKGNGGTLLALFYGLRQGNGDRASEHEVKPLNVVLMEGHQEPINVDQHQQIIIPQVVWASYGPRTKSLNMGMFST